MQRSGGLQQRIQRSQPKPISGKRPVRGRPAPASDDLPIAQSLPANFHSRACPPRAPSHRPLKAPSLKPPRLDLPPSPADFQNDYIRGKTNKRATPQLSFSLSKYRGPTVSASMPAWNPHMERLMKKVERPPRSRLETIAGSPLLDSSDPEGPSVTTFTLLGEKPSRPFPSIVHDGSRLKGLENESAMHQRGLLKHADADINEEGDDDDDDDDEASLNELDDGFFNMEL